MTGIYDSCNGWRNWATRGIGEAFKEDEGFTAPAWKWWCAGQGMTRKEAEEYIAKQIEKWVYEEYDKICNWADWKFRDAIAPPSMMDIDYRAIARAVMDDYEDIVDKCRSDGVGRASDTRSSSKARNAPAKKKAPAKKSANRAPSRRY